VTTRTPARVPGLDPKGKACLGGCRIPAAGCRLPRAFTLIEVLVASIILVVLAGLIVPRLTTSDLRTARQDVERVRSLVSSVALRDALSADRLALEYGGDTNTLSAVVLRPDDPDRPLDSRLLWQPDPLLAPVRLDAVRVERAEMHAEARTTAPWRIVVTNPDADPELFLVLAPTDDRLDRRWTIVVGRGSRAARIVEGDIDRARATVEETGAIDLDATGRREEPW